MEQIIYISTARGEVPSAMLHDILAASRRNNARDGLTGLLIVGGRRFLQVLEGPRAKTDETYRRIRADARHFALVELSRKRITERGFPDWEMGFQEAGAAGGLIDIVERLIEPLSDPSLRAELTGFAQLHGRAA